jgi:hypothetical protein
MRMPSTRIGSGQSSSGSGPFLSSCSTGASCFRGSRPRDRCSEWCELVGAPRACRVESGTSKAQRRRTGIAPRPTSRSPTRSRRAPVPPGGSGHQPSWSRERRHVVAMCSRSSASFRAPHALRGLVPHSGCAEELCSCERGSSLAAKVLGPFRRELTLKQARRPPDLSEVALRGAHVATPLRNAVAGGVRNRAPRSRHSR